MESSDNLALNCAGNEFFDILEKNLRTKISKLIRNILIINDLDTSLIFATFNDNTIGDLENFTRNVLNINMLQGDETMADYLGRYVKCQEKFEFSYGQKLMIKMIADACVKFYAPHPTTRRTDSLMMNHQISNHDYHGEQQNDASKMSNISELFRSIYKWIRSQETLKQVKSFHKFKIIVVAVFKDFCKFAKTNWFLRW